MTLKLILTKKLKVIKLWVTKMGGCPLSFNLTQLINELYYLNNA